jgi:hypothetical protein
VDLGAGVRPTTTSFVRALLIPFVASPYKVHLPPHFKITPVTTFGSLIRHNNSRMQWRMQDGGQAGAEIMEMLIFTKI